jgi:hypothetical protein
MRDHIAIMPQVACYLHYCLYATDSKVLFNMLRCGCLGGAGVS